ncbi:V-type ATP synthase subunit I [Aerococcus sanguinicola]|uniref:V-type ATP synthase subunit I n=1 Tax=unclassified Aerococcus TaxID=2618060 RepID=UPI0008A15C2E|nr:MULTISPECIES: V-type ATP synthase subunit I [unclassified Aerococcus]KAB0647304.1 V-type ATP synthase subunit I [Aerococcus sanguinicola]MDK6233234.1 V-type ATP synthase subunit I [Aerococcus sp. UMB10185]MDK6856071.1 V-type ATP synthase subunit I [Aerococcus sp. UMB7533]MDK8503033.1 V-type ATP synthase subunit I [Aerococcus sp. UMB1112A]
MAIAKMKKLSIVSKPALKEDLVRNLQALQSVEVSALPREDAEDAVDAAQVKSEDYVQYDDLYQRAERALVILSRYAKDRSMMEKLTHKRPVFSLEGLHQEVDLDQGQALIEEVEKLYNQRENIISTRETVEDEQTAVSNWRSLDVNPAELYQLDHFAVSLGTVPNDSSSSQWHALKEDTKDEDISLLEAFSNEDEIGVVAVTRKSQAEDFQGRLAQYHFQPFDYPYEEGPETAFQNLEDKRKSLIKEEEEVVQALQTLEAKIPLVEQVAEETYNRSQHALAVQLTYDNDYLILLSGWTDEEDYDALIQKLEASIGADNFVVVEEEITEEAIDNNEVPTKLKNNALNAPFEMITEMYGVPNYREIDPTPFITPFYLLFFGMMMGDLGYGLVLWLGTLVAMKMMDLHGSAGNMVKFGHYLSYPTMLVGLLYGSFFGESIPTGIVDPTGDAILIMAASVVIGLIHILVALCIKIYLEVRRGNMESAYSDGLGWILILLGLGAWGIGAMAGMPEVGTIGKWVSIIGFAGMIIVPVIFQDKKLLAAGLGLYNIYGISGYVGDLVSYTRLMALGISGGSIAMAFNMLVGFFPAPIRFTIGIVLIIALQSFNLFLSVLSGYVHGLRLIFVEFFGKFYEGDGRAFSPINTLEKYVRLNNSDK